MGQEEDKINDLEKRYRELWDRHQALKEEIRTNYAEFKAWKEGKTSVTTEKQSSVEAPIPSSEDRPVQAETPKKEKQLIDWEHFVGEKLLARIGIAIVLIGVAIGVKYAIDHQLIGVGLRIAGGYLVGVILGFVAIRLHKKYEAFSAILGSGALSTIYFMTYAGYAFYQVFPLGLAFGGMLLTVIATVFAALRMNRVIIAHLGLAGAYLLPPLVSTGNQHISYYLGYMLLINVGMLVLSFLRAWKSLFIPIIAWSIIIFIVWFADDFRPQDTWLATIYIWLFYIVISLGVKASSLRLKESLDAWGHTQLFALTTFTFLGLNAAGHNSDLMNLLAGVVPVLALVLYWLKDKQLADNSGTDLHLWLGIAAMFMLPFSACYPVFILAIATSIWSWWAMGVRVELIRILGALFTGIMGLVIMSTGFTRTMGGHTEVAWMNDYVLALVLLVVFHLVLYWRQKAQFAEDENRIYVQINSLVLVTLTAVSGFMAIKYAGNLALAELKDSKEPITIFTNLDRLDPNKAQAYRMLGYLWMAFVVACSIWYRKAVLAMVNGYRTGIRISFLLGLLFLLIGVTYGNSWSDDFKNRDVDRTMFEAARYGFFILLCFIGWFQWRSMRESTWELAFGHVGLLWLLSLELIHWSLIYEIGVGYKLLLSLLWGTYAVFLLIRGLKTESSALRVTALSVLGVMLMKLFFYDLTMLSTITKTLVFLLVGGLLLVGGYFYQRMSKQQEE